MVIVQLLYVQREQDVSPDGARHFDPDLDEALDGTAAAT
jgi:hypothetical protein